MLKLDRSWDALLQPGVAASYFDGLAQIPFDVATDRFHPVNAWWMAEISRLIYRNDRDELPNTKGKSRAEFLAQVGLRELSPLINLDSTQCTVIRSDGRTHPDLAIVVFRGSQDVRDWVTNFRAVPVPWRKGGSVHLGFARALDRVWPAIEQKLGDFNGPLFYTGHSLGAALATLAASLRRPKAVYAFGAPRIGDRTFAQSLAGIPIFRIVNNRDVVPTIPRLLLEPCGETQFIDGQGKLLVNPKITDSLPALEFSLTRPPEFLADHAPINYVYWMSQCAKG